MLLPPILIPVCNSSSPAFLMMCSAYRINKQGQQTTLLYSFLNPEPTSFSNCCFLTHIQVSQETGKTVWYSHLFKSFQQFIMFHTVKGFVAVNETEIDVFLTFPCFLYDPANVGDLKGTLPASSCWSSHSQHPHKSPQ